MDEQIFSVCVGKLSKEEIGNIAREIRSLWSRMENVWPQGDRKRAPRLKVTLDAHGQYHVYLNHQALVYILLFCKNIPDPIKKPVELECPPEVPDFLRWGSKPGSTA